MEGQKPLLLGLLVGVASDLRPPGLRLAQSGGPTARVSVLPFLPEDIRRSSFRNVVILLKYRRRIKSKNPVLQIIQHHRQNPSDLSRYFSFAPTVSEGHITSTNEFVGGFIRPVHFSEHSPTYRMCGVLTRSLNTPTTSYLDVYIQRLTKHHTNSKLGLVL
jgi:hypothetical protein